MTCDVMTRLIAGAGETEGERESVIAWLAQLSLQGTQATSNRFLARLLCSEPLRMRVNAVKGVAY